MSQRQHYVPQFYLRKFCNLENGKVHVYDKLKNTTFQASTKNIMVVGDFYAGVNIDGDKRQDVEDKIHPKIEIPGSNVLNKLIQGAELNESDKKDLCIYLMHQYIRTPNQSETLKKWLEVFSQKLIPKLFKNQNAKLNHVPLKNTKGSYPSMTGVNGHFAAERCAKEMSKSILKGEYFWKVISQNSGEPDLITNDKPVNLFNGYWNMVNADCRFEWLFFPINAQNLLVVGIKEPTYSHMKWFFETDNLFQSMNNVYFKDATRFVVSNNETQLKELILINKACS